MASPDGGGFLAEVRGELEGRSLRAKGVARVSPMSRLVPQQRRKRLYSWRASRLHVGEPVSIFC